MQHRAPREPAGDILNSMLSAIKYEAFLYDSEEPRAAETKWKNVMDFVDWLSKKGSSEEKNLLELTQTVALMSMLEGRENGEPDAVKLSCCQRPGVRPCIPDRGGRRHPAASRKRGQR